MFVYIRSRAVWNIDSDRKSEFITCFSWIPWSQLDQKPIVANPFAPTESVSACDNPIISSPFLIPKWFRSIERTIISNSKIIWIFSFGSAIILHHQKMIRNWKLTCNIKHSKSKKERNTKQTNKTQKWMITMLCIFKLLILIASVLCI